MEYSYTDEKWKPSKTDSSNYYSSTTSTASLMRSISQKSTSTSKSPLLRSFSQKSFSFKSPLSRSSSSKPPLSRSSSFKSPLSGTSSPKSSATANSKSLLSRSSSQKCSEFTRKCSSLAKEQRARFYIVKRCVKMLVCWKKNSDS
ncbi:hypothetical protein RHMOL_Rhmol13G0095800 [Rhododendron molle]|uniref:Uncharacterized protein n=1 Tax=Rhododendron molle TaxID=49168 RepID=A0ACC0L6A1_RHOML|nr:hypothetical protein RHMOL_Rhmol13G0095800 [Rhododendron molle]